MVQPKVVSTKKSPNNSKGRQNIDNQKSRKEVSRTNANYCTLVETKSMKPSKGKKEEYEDFAKEKLVQPKSVIPKKSPNDGKGRQNIDNAKSKKEVFGTNANYCTLVNAECMKDTKGKKDEYEDFAKKVGNMLQANAWYHGLMPREEIEEMLVQNGDFLVRRTEVGGKTRLAISIKNKGRIRHILITLSDGKWSLRNLKMGSLTGLIAEHVRTKTPVQADGTILVRPVPRPDYYILHDHVTIQKKIGGGAFGDVHIGILKQDCEDDITVAIKTLKGVMAKKDRAQFMKEAKIMRRFSHPNIVNLLGVAPQEDPVMIILEMCPNGALNSKLKKNPQIPVEKLVVYATDAARGMLYLSSRRIIHRDIAARNCLLGKNDEVKISDFGLSVADQSVISVAKLRQMPVRWLAPETLRKGQFSTKTDVWSYGVMLWEIFSRCKTDPYPGMTNGEARTKILSKTIPMTAPEGTPSIIVGVMVMCFIQEPDNRPEFSNLFRMLAPYEQIVDHDVQTS